MIVPPEFWCQFYAIVNGSMIVPPEFWCQFYAIVNEIRVSERQNVRIFYV